ncbi:hypothetical protein [Maridesulfovibrio sp.]|uniref:hypothetical protein n=1 Tax=Maridesulfovibrio sp. TaxID=2795000 RepID=UPI0029CA5957|nr:hypothetical protein [Maridesulfovibrio sp.]
MRKLFPLLILLVFVAAGCGGSEVKLELPKDTSKATIDLINHAIPTLKAQCPGWNKYGDVLQFERIYTGSPYYPTSDSDEVIYVTWIQFKVPNDADVPAQYRAHGNILHLGFTENGKAIIFKKAQTARIFLDENIDSGGRDYVIPIS